MRRNRTRSKREAGYATKTVKMKPEIARKHIGLRVLFVVRCSSFVVFWVRRIGPRLARKRNRMIYVVRKEKRGVGIPSLNEWLTRVDRIDRLALLA